MSPFLASAAIALVAITAAPGLGHLAGMPARPPLRPARGRLGADLLRTFAALAVLPLAVGGSDGDLVVAAVLAAAALGRRLPALALTPVLVGAVAALRVGSSAVEDISGAQAVLGPAVLSPAVGVAAAAALAALAAAVAAAAAIPAAPRGGFTAGFRNLAFAADALLVPVALLLAVAVAGGPPLVDGQGARWAVVRFATVGAGALAVALVRRLAGARRTDHLAAAAAALAVAAVVTAMATL